MNVFKNIWKYLTIHNSLPVSAAYKSSVKRLLTVSNLKGSPHSYEYLHFRVLHFQRPRIIDSFWARESSRLVRDCCNVNHLVRKFSQ